MISNKKVINCKVIDFVKYILHFDVDFVCFQHCQPFQIQFRTHTK